MFVHRSKGQRIISNVLVECRSRYWNHLWENRIANGHLVLGPLVYNVPFLCTNVRNGINTSNGMHWYRSKQKIENSNFIQTDKTHSIENTRKYFPISIYTIQCGCCCLEQNKLSITWISIAWQCVQTCQPFDSTTIRWCHAWQFNNHFEIHISRAHST